MLFVLALLCWDGKLRLFSLKRWTLVGSIEHFPFQLHTDSPQHQKMLTNSGLLRIMACKNHLSGTWNMRGVVEIIVNYSARWGSTFSVTILQQSMFWFCTTQILGVYTVKSLWSQNSITYGLKSLNSQALPKRKVAAPRYRKFWRLATTCQAQNGDINKELLYLLVY